VQLAKFLLPEVGNYLKARDVAAIITDPRI
jgi:hypothetical protein